MIVFQRGPANWGVEYSGCEKIAILRPIARFISEMIWDGAIITIQCQYKTAPKLSNSTISQWRWATANRDFKVMMLFNVTNSKTVQNRAIPYLQDQAIQSRTVRLCIAWSCKYGTRTGIWSIIFNNLEWSITRFQSHAVFYAECLTNGTRYRHSLMSAPL